MVRALTRIRRNVGSATRRRASDATAGGGAFVGENAEALAEADATHWWFRSKAAFVSWAIRHHSDVAGRLVDLGAGAAGVTAQLGWPPGETVAVDASGFLVEQAHRRHPLHVARGDTAAVPLADGAAHVVCLLDVIEHLADPGPALDEARRLLAADGILVVNVPAHPNLWSAADEVLGHARRYTRASLRDELERHGFAVTWMSHVFSWLYVPVWAKRRLRPGDEPQLGLDARSPLLSAASLVLTRLEWAVVSRAPLPVGTSVLCVARRASPTP
jgi:SAM-dependent methyltransferase